MSLTAAQILDLAPDAASRKAGQDQAKPTKWSGLSRAGEVVWGEIKGSGASPYRTAADLAGPASKCTCPSRKFPCKHGLGLMLVQVASPEAFSAADPPDWVSAWLKGRAARAAPEARPDAPAKPVDEAARAKRRQARADRVAAALDEFDLWLRDLLRRGLSSAHGEPYGFWDRVAGRLVDGQAPGLARRVRALSGLAAGRAGPAPAGAPGPEEALALAVGRLGLLLRAARRLDALDPEQAAGARAAIGHPVGAEELAVRPGHTDDWAVLAHGAEEDDKLLARSVWLVGRRSGRIAQVLDFGAPGAPLPPAPAAGQDFRGELAFYPGAPPLRAVFRDGRAGPSPAAPLPGAGTVAAALDAWAGALSRAPWIERWPLRLADVRLGLMNGAGRPVGVGDGTGALPLVADGRTRALVAVAAGRPVDLFGLYDGFGLAPLALLTNGRFYAVPAQDPLPLLRRVA